MKMLNFAVVKIVILFDCMSWSASVLSGPIVININANGNNATLEFSGHIEDYISNEDKESFQITEENLKLGAKTIMGSEPIEVSLGHWKEIYRERKWRPVKRILKPIRGKVLKIHSEPVVISRQKFSNSLLKPGTFRAGISSEIRNTISSTWSYSKIFSADKQITFSIQFVSMSLSTSFTTNYGVSAYKEKSTTVGSSSEVSVTLGAGEEVEAVLSATRGSADIQVEYMAALRGDVACKFPGSYKGRTLWRQDINTVLDAIEMPLDFWSTQTLRIGTYSEAKVTLYNMTSNRVIDVHSAVFGV